MAKKAKVKQPKLDAKELSASYGWAMATLNSVPELKSLFETAVKKQYTPERFAASLQSTSWFQNTAEPARKYTVLRTAEPADYVSRMKQVMSSLADQYSQMTGDVLPVNYPSVQGNTVVDGQGFLAHVADQSLRLGLNESQIRDMLFSSVDWKQKIQTHTIGGQASGQLQSFRQQAAAYGVQPSDDWMAEKVGRVTLGDESPEGVLGALKQMSKQRYSHFADQIDAGATIEDIADNYRQSMAKVLEINPNSIDVFDRQIQEGLKARPVQGGTGGQVAAMNIGDFEDHLRRDSRWEFTENAKDTILSQGQGVLKSMGLVA